MTSDPLEMSEADLDFFIRCMREHREAHTSIKAELNARPCLTPDELEACVDVLTVTFGLVQHLQHQRDRLDAGLPIVIEETLPTAETAMLRACALEVQLCGTSCVTQLERYSYPTNPRGRDVGESPL